MGGRADRCTHLQRICKRVALEYSHSLGYGRQRRPYPRSKSPHIAQPRPAVEYQRDSFHSSASPRRVRCKYEIPHALAHGAVYRFGLSEAYQPAYQSAQPPVSLKKACQPVCLTACQPINQTLRAGSQERPTPSFLKILRSTSPSMTVECTWQPSSSGSFSRARRQFSS